MFRCQKVAVQARNCFRHSHEGCKKSNLPKSNVKSCTGNQIAKKVKAWEKDLLLQDLGYEVHVIRLCDTKNDAELIWETWYRESMSSNS